MDLQENQINQSIPCNELQKFFEKQKTQKNQVKQIQQLWQVPICQKRQILNIVNRKQSKNNHQNQMKQVVNALPQQNFKQVTLNIKTQQLLTNQNQNKNKKSNKSNQNIIQENLLQEKNVRFYDPYEALFFDRKIQSQNKNKNKEKYFKKTKIQPKNKLYIQDQQQKNLLNISNCVSNNNDINLKNKLILSNLVNGNPNNKTNLLIAQYINLMNSEKQISQKNIKMTKVKYKVKPQPDDVFIIIKQKRIKKYTKETQNDIQQTIQIKNQKKNKKYQKILIKNGRKIYVYKEKYYYPKNQCKTKDQIQFQNSDLYLCQFQMRAQVQNLRFNMPYEEWKLNKIKDLENRKIL